MGGSPWRASSPEVIHTEGPRGTKEKGRTDWGLEFLTLSVSTKYQSETTKVRTSLPALSGGVALKTCTFPQSQTPTCGLRRLLRSTLPAVLRISLIGVPLRRWVGVPLRRWGSHRPHRLLWIRWVWGRWARARIWWRVLWIHQEPSNAPKRQRK